MKKLLLTAIILYSLFISCSKDDIKIDPDNLLIGTWIYTKSHNNLDVYTRSLNFEDKHCYRFNLDGTMLERNIAGWCGTPPVTYDNYDGTWSYFNDSILNIKVEYWGGTRDYRLGIYSVDRDSLKVEFLPEN
jgi:hypothetical protein